MPAGRSSSAGTTHSSVAGPCSGSAPGHSADLLLGHRAAELVDEDFFRGLEFLQEFVPEELQARGLPVRASAIAALTLVDEGMIDETAFLFVDHKLLARCAFEAGSMSSISPRSRNPRSTPRMRLRMNVLENRSSLSGSASH